MAIPDTNSPSLASIGYDPFSYPHLYPSGWNLDDLPNKNQASDPEPELMPKKSSLPAWYEPFQDLRTFPAGWDLP
jgi:hypothetical protein